jgi:hypothetical protein
MGGAGVVGYVGSALCATWIQAQLGLSGPFFEPILGERGSGGCSLRVLRSVAGPWPPSPASWSRRSVRLMRAQPQAARTDNALSSESSFRNEPAHSIRTY